MVESRKNGREKREEGRNSKREVSGETREAHDTESFKRNDSFINKTTIFSSYICLFYRVEEERRNTKGCVKFIGGSYGHCFSS